MITSFYWLGDRDSEPDAHPPLRDIDRERQAENPTVIDTVSGLF